MNTAGRVSSRQPSFLTHTYSTLALSTGDVGQWDERGRLVVIDRVKNIFKLAQGEYIAPEKIESVLAKHYLVAQVFVYGHSLKATLVGIVVPDFETLRLWANSNGLAGKSDQELCDSPEVQGTLLKELATFGRESDLKGFEILKNITVVSEQFTIENDLLVSNLSMQAYNTLLQCDVR